MQDIEHEQKENSNPSECLESQICSDSQKYAEIINSKLKVRILMTLLIYSELTLSQLSQKMGKVKSTISKHMEDLLALDLVKRRERKYRSDKKQHIYSKVKSFGYRGKTFDDLKDLSSEDFLEHMEEEYIINKRLFTYILEVNQQILEFVEDFYKFESDTISDEFKEDVYRYNTCIPRIKFMTKDEYKEYRKQFLEFDNAFITKMEQNRLNEVKDRPKEYLTITEFVPIRQVMEYYIDTEKKEK
jgi:predicted transcriptional regulator